MQRRGLLLAVLTVFSLAAIAAPATAHNTVSTADGQYFLTIGHLNEPVTTYVKTGFDLTVRANVSGQRGGEIDGVHQTLSAVYKAPSGKTMEGVLTKQFGTTGKYTFDDPFILTEPGQYTVRLVGKVNNTSVDMEANVAGPVPDFRDHTFPDDVQTQKQLQDRIAALEAQVADLEAHMAQDEHDETAQARGFSPGLDAIVLVGVVGLAGLLLRRRA